MIRPSIAGGSPEPLGVSLVDGGVNVAVHSANADAIEFCLFDAAGDAELRHIQLPERTGDVFHGFIADVGEGARYGLRAHGRFAPAAGFRFNPSKLLLDPYALAIDRPFRLHPSMFGSRPGDIKADDQDSAAAMPKGIVIRPGEGVAGASFVPWGGTVLYELHVRGFTMRNEKIPEGLRGTFAGLGHPAAIQHLTQLGITSVEIMPSAAWIEERHLSALGLSNYWGYNPIGLMAPDPRLAPGGWAEIRATVAALEAAGIETILDVVLNHSGEGDALGPTVSLRGLDNALYYRLNPVNPAAYIDDAGCGNVLALDRPPVLRLAMDSLRAWARFGGVHGFRFDLAPTLGRRADGFDPAAPLLSAIAQDPMLRDLKLVVEPWDVGPGGYQVGAFSAQWGEWNDRFRDDIRRFWRGDPAELGVLATRIAGSADLFAAKRRPSRSVNFVTAHDGFTLADLVSYERKHNEANGEQNRDGTDANLSWNHGVEGPTGNAAVNAARLADQRALLGTLLLARGTPMLAMGAELGHSQDGNNNAYAQDNETTWIDWAKPDSGLANWTRRLIAIRRDHSSIRGDRFLSGRPIEGGVATDVEWLRPDGRAMEPADWQAPDGVGLVVALTGVDGDRVVLVFNRGRAEIDVTLPEPDVGQGWRILTDSAAPGDPGGAIAECALVARAASVTVLDQAPLTAAPAIVRSGRAVALARLAAAAGIASEWWEVNGTRHEVSDSTRRALLAAMDLPATTEREALATLRGLADGRDRRPLPVALTGWAGEPAVLETPLARGLSRRPLSLIISTEDGATRAIRVGADDGVLAPATACDGSEHQLWRVELPPLPIGRYSIVREDAPDSPCHLTIAPRRCYLPPALTDGGRRFGVAAQLYAIRRPGDQGIGDFSTLGDLGALAAGHGAATLGINPLHALFPDQRERASPYQPSDRRFLDPIYLDVAGLGDAGAAAALSGLSHVDYAAVWALKRAALEQSFIHSDFDRQGFDAFVAAGGTGLRRFAIFNAIAETRPGEPWRRWPGGLADAASLEIDVFAATHPGRVRFHQYLQYLCAGQLAAAVARAGAAGLDIGLLHDLAVGAAPDGAEVWAGADLYAHGVSVGAPPDPLAPQGQVWGLPPPNPLRMATTGFAGFAELLAANMRHAGGLRIDHVMGLSRLFWVPEGADGGDGAYVAYPFRDLLPQVTLESTRSRCLVVGEDLGTVPDGLRAELSEADILSYRVLLLEREGLGFRPAAAYPEAALACVTTHDLPTFFGWWAAADIRERQSLGLIEPGEVERALSDREAEKTGLTKTLAGEGLPAPIDEASDPPPEILTAVHEFIANSPSALVMAQADDLAGEVTGVNLPGTNTERPNWRRKLTPPLPDLLDTESARAILEGFRGRK